MCDIVIPFMKFNFKQNIHIEREFTLNNIQT